MSTSCSRRKSGKSLNFLLSLDGLDKRFQTWYVRVLTLHLLNVHQFSHNFLFLLALILSIKNMLSYFLNQEIFESWHLIRRESKRCQIICFVQDSEGRYVGGVAQLWTRTSQNQTSNIRIWFERDDTFLVDTCLAKTDLAYFADLNSYLHIFFDEVNKLSWLGISHCDFNNSILFDILTIKCKQVMHL